MTLLAEVADIQTGPFGSQLHKKDYVASGRPIVTVEHLGKRAFTRQNLPFVSEFDAERLKKYQMKHGDVIFSRVGSVDRCSYAEKRNEGWLFSGRCLRIRPKKSIDPEFLYYYLSSKAIKDFVRNIAVGATMPSINTTLMGEIPIPAISLDRQRAIACIMSSLDIKLQANAKLNGYLEELARAMYVSAMQEHADIASLCDLAEFNPETYSPKENWSAVSYIDTSALMLNDLAGLQHFNPAEEKLPTRARRKVSNGDILYSTVRPNQNHYGLLYSPEPHTLASTAFAVIRPNDTIMSPLVYLALTDARITKTLQQLAETSTSTIPSIRPVDLERIAVLVPSDEYGSEIADQIGTTFKQIDCNKRENRKLAAFRDALLPKLMSGEIDVSKIDLTQLNSHLVDC